MATQNKITEIIAAIKTIYPYYAKDTDVAVLVKTWTLLLKDYPDKAVDVAFYKCLQTCKMPPTPADVIERLNAIQEATEQTDEELWSKFTKAIKNTDRQIGYIQYPLFGETSEDARKRIQAIWDALPERLKQYVGSKGELMRIARTFSDEELKFEKTRFMKSMPQIKDRADTQSLLLLLDNSGGVAFGRIEGGNNGD